MSFELRYGESRNFTKLIETVDSYAPFIWPVLIFGETGVGKELIARRVHFKSNRSQAPFVPVNCGAIPPGLFESELFGHERGAFSGATQASRGMIRQAHGGTLFLDEIGELDLPLQVKLLRLLELGEVRALGSNRIEQVNVRVVAATNVDLNAAVRKGLFRQDLLERLSVLTLQVPPLRERSEDIPLLARHILVGLSCLYSEEALVMLARYEWPGNVRQLRNVLVRGSIRGNGKLNEKLLEELLREELARSSGSDGVGEDFLEGSLAEIEKQVIVERLRRCHGNRKRAAKELGIAKSTLHEKLRKWKEESAEEDNLAPPWPLSRWAARPGLVS